MSELVLHETLVASAAATVFVAKLPGRAHSRTATWTPLRLAVDGAPLMLAAVARRARGALPAIPDRHVPGWRVGCTPLKAADHLETSPAVNRKSLRSQNRWGKA